MDDLIDLDPSPGVSVLAIELVDELFGLGLRRSLRILPSPLLALLDEDAVLVTLSMGPSDVSMLAEQSDLMRYWQCRS